MIIKKENKNGITIYHLDKEISDDKMEQLKNTFVKKEQIKLIIVSDADVYDMSENLLIRFRKNKLSKNKINDFYENVIDFAKKNPSTNRGSASGSKNKNILDNPKIMSNVIGYIDSFSPKQKELMNKQGKKIRLNARQARFNADYPLKFKKLLPLVKEIDHYYKKYAPSYYEKQIKKAKQTNFKIPGTSFTTITTNVNFQTSIHKDKGDDGDGIGNLSVIEKGKYKGGETCLPQYGLGVDVRTGDILFINVHEWHGNLPLSFEEKDAVRLSIVCYLRINVWKNTIGVTKKKMIKHNNDVLSLKKKTIKNKDNL